MMALITHDLSRQDATSPDEEYILTIKDAGRCIGMPGSPARRARSNAIAKTILFGDPLILDLARSNI